MSTLRIHLFGGLRLIHEEPLAEIKVTRTVQGLLAYLLLHRHRSHSRDSLMGLFWGDHRQDQARNCLNTAIWRLRSVLEPAGVARGTYLLTNLGDVQFNTASDHWLDVGDFESRVRAALLCPAHEMTVTAAAALTQGLDLHSGELLEGVYDDWAMREREHLRDLYLSGLTCLMEYHQARSAYQQSLAYGQQILQHEPLREDIHRAMIRIYNQSGQRAQVVRQYETCRDLLAAELGVTPLPETQALYRQLVGHGHLVRAEPAETASLQQTLHHLHEAMHNFAAAQAHLQEAVQFIERLTERH